MSDLSIDALNVRLPTDVLDELSTLTHVRHHFHQHPELKNEETQTQRYILEFLTNAGIEASPIGGTGVVGTIRGNSAGKTILLRADMDALPIQEQTGLPYKSTTPGVMHACGHDAHMAMLLVTAKLLANRGLDHGQVRLLFQPAEEGGGGAQSMIDNGILENPVPDCALAFHVWSPYSVGEVAVLDGPVMASVDGFEITVTGTGTHGAIPDAGIDPIPIMSQIICSSQTIISRKTSAHTPAVLSFCAVNGGSTFNIIPSEVSALGTIRTFDDTVRENIKKELIAIGTNIAQGMGATATIAFFEEICATHNDPAMANTLRKVCKPIVGSENIILPNPLMVGEDMGLILNKIPGAMVLLGCKNEMIGATYPHHHPMFHLDERVMPIGVAVALGYISEYLNLH